MGLETATYISQLDKLAPLSGDQRKQGDDHLRLIKAVLKNTFPGVGGQGFASPITAKETEINFLAGVTSNIQTQINALKTQLNAPVGTRMWFYQAAAPTGWTIVVTSQNYVLISASPNGGVAGGGGGAGHNVVSGCTVVASHTHTVNPASITTSSHAGHAHNAGVATSTTTPGGSFGVSYLASTGDTNPTTTAGAHTHTVDIPSTTTSTNTALDVWQPVYYANILGQKA